ARHGSTPRQHATAARHGSTPRQHATAARHGSTPRQHKKNQQAFTAAGFFIFPRSQEEAFGKDQWISFFLNCPPFTS
ncbi:hypothetical protein, partial [Paenibacillus chitinolyticus]|uniref:hypothetical protein n=1 Tax=Paenibacillus chitinolyticus TaxID=79263 RepID=UPI00362B3733